ncbi:hypothetical protein BJ684DRAFT_15201 [Piptocephalis cylindrospora]|uniref:START domain-containing protein n=1 Tax=Piptocephalis cylindrospora TaxID=1907219 RepID=A0A4P9Y908_9FUNG|nr:hypothetical protein BJ684DRAFT_15201 [Piptocephalis cylindrospora]|eukprot:RKP14480.1 hypothetical protein BJ684DRAFT_15201 [Piptocephalis cylindrospora]
MTVSISSSKDTSIEKATAEAHLSSLESDPDLTILDPSLTTSSPSSRTDSGSEDSGQDTRSPPTPTSISSTSGSHDARLASLSLRSVKTLAIPSAEWKTLIRHGPSGMEVSRHRPAQDRHSIYRGQLDIPNSTPTQVWSVIKEKSLWDDWYVRGEHLSDTGSSSSLTRLIMKPPIPGVNIRDFVLLENLSMPTSKEILFCSTSLPSSDIPVSSGHVRGHLSLHVFYLTPCPGDGEGTRLTYLIQINARSWIPRSLARAVMARRPLVLLRIQKYLQGKYGSIPKEVSSKNVPVGENGRLTASAIRLDCLGPLKGNYLDRVDKLQEFALIHTPFLIHYPSSQTGALERPKAPKRQETAPASLSSTMSKTEEHIHSGRLHEAWSLVKEAREAIAAPKPSPTQWTLGIEGAEGVQVHCLLTPPQGSKLSLSCFRASLDLEGVRLEEVATVIRSLDCRQAWDDRFEGGHLVRELSPARSHLQVLNFKGAFPVSARDQCVATDFAAQLDGSLVYLTTSCEDPDVPVNNGRVRSSLDFSAWILQEQPHPSSGGAPLVKVTWVEQGRLRGSLPTSMARTSRTLGLRRERYRADDAFWEAAFTPHPVAARCGCEVHVPVAWGNDWYVKAVGEVKGRTGKEAYEGRSYEIHRIPRGFRLVVLRVDEQENGKDLTVVVRVSGRAVPANTPRSLSISSLRHSSSSSTSSSSSRPFSPGASTLCSTPTTELEGGKEGPWGLRQRVASKDGKEPPKTSALISSSTSPLSTHGRPLSGENKVKWVVHPTSLSNDPIQGRRITRHRRTLTFTKPTIPVRIVRWAGFEDAQVVGVLISVVIAFYLGMAYERFILQGLLAHW